MRLSLIEGELIVTAIVEAGDFATRVLTKSQVRCSNRELRPRSNLDTLLHRIRGAGFVRNGTAWRLD
jgi:hypothetical protein